MAAFDAIQPSPWREDEGGGIQRPNHHASFVITRSTGQENRNPKVEGVNGATDIADLDAKIPKVEALSVEGDISSRSDEGSIRTTPQADEAATEGVRRTRRRKGETESSSGGLETPQRLRVGRSAKRLGGSPSKAMGEENNENDKGMAQSNVSTEVKSESGALKIHSGTIEVEDEAEAISALAAVMKVHQFPKEAVGPVADFPGETGVDSKRQCYVCEKPETAKSTIVCDKCQRSYHLSCVMLKPKQALENEHWQCESCGVDPGWDYWPLGGISANHNREKADLQWRLVSSEINIPEPSLVTSPATDAAVEDYGIRILLATKTVTEKNEGRGEAGSVENRNVSEPKGEGVILSLGKPNEIPLKRGRGRPRKNSNVLQGQVITSASVELVHRDIESIEGRPASNLRDVSSLSPSVSTPTVSTPTVITQSPVGGVADIMHAANVVEIQGDPTVVTLSDDDLQNDEIQIKDPEALEDLRRFICSKNGQIGIGWDAVRKRRPANLQVFDKIYISPDNKKFRSRLQVARFLGLHGKDNHRKSNVQNAAQRPQFPFRCGDLLIEHFGIVSMRYMNTEKTQIWPVGYRASWHDLETGSFCTSEILDSRESRPVFRITRKSCMSISKENALEAEFPSSGREINTTSMSEVETDILILPKITPVNNKVVIDPIGEFLVDAESPAEAWGRFARLFIEKLQTSSVGLQALRALCAHAGGESIVRFNPERYHEERANLGRDQSYPHVEPPTAIIEQPDDMASKDEAGALRLLEKRLSDDRFGLDQQLVQETIRDVLQRNKVGAEKAEQARVRSWKRKEKKDREKETVETLGVSEAGMQWSIGNNLNRERLLDINGCELVAGPEKSLEKRFEPAVKEDRVLPPAGELLTRRIPAELVGDTLQVWEFLCRFSDVIGLKSPLTYEELETGFVSLGPPVPIHLISEVEVQPSAKPSSREGENRDFAQASTEAGDSNPEEPVAAGVGHSRDSCGGGTGGLTGNDPSVGGSVQGGDLKAVTCGVDLMSEKKANRLRQGDSLDMESAKITSVQQNGALTPVSAKRPGEEVCTVERAVAFSDGTLNEQFVMIARTHIPLLRLLLADLQFRITGNPTASKSEEPKKKGRKPLNEAPQVTSIPEFPTDLPINEVTWPELVRRYLIAHVEVEKFGDLTELKQQERKWLMRCLQGDGGEPCGAECDIMSAEKDAQVLAEAEKELAIRIPKTDGSIEEEDDLADGLDELPQWVEALRPVAKMATNVGSRIRTKVKEALDLDPPEWAKETLEWSISKDVFKGNASGPTKKAVIEVLNHYDVSPPCESPTHKASTKKRVPSIDQIMQRCRVVLRTVADADKTEAFSVLVNGVEGHGSRRLRGIVARPLDFRTIDARLSAGAYGGSVDAFAEDVRQIWRNVESLQKGGELLELAAALSKLFEDLLQKQVLNLLSGDAEVKSAESKHEIADVVEEGKELVNGNLTTEKPEDKLQKAPWEDNDTCRVCGVDEDYESIMLCDKCDAEYHTYCLNPPLDKVPEGNWFCPECLALDKGFPDKQSAKDREVVEHESLEGEDEQFPADRVLEDAETKDVKEVLGESAAQSLLKQVEGKEYWQLGFSERIHVLKFLCDESLKTTQVRAHLEKSLDMASELQQQLSNLFSEREDALINLEDQDRQRREKSEGLKTRSQTAKEVDTSNVESWSTRLRHHSAGGVAAEHVSPALPRLLHFDSNCKEDEVPAAGPMAQIQESGKEEKLDSSSAHNVSRQVNKLDEKAKIGVPGTRETMSDGMVIEVPASVEVDTSEPASTSVINTKKRKHVDVDVHEVVVVVADGEAEEVNASEKIMIKNSKRAKVEDYRKDGEPGAEVTSCLEPNEKLIVDINNATRGSLQADAGDSKVDFKTINVKDGAMLAEDADDEAKPVKDSVNSEIVSNGEVDHRLSSGDPHGSMTVARSSTSKVDGNIGRVSKVETDEVLVSGTPVTGTKNNSREGEATDLGAESGRRIPVRSCRLSSELPGSSIARVKKGTAGAGLPPRTPKRKLEMTSNCDIQKKPKTDATGAPTCNGEGISEGNVIFTVSSLEECAGTLAIAQGTPALGEVIDDPHGGYVSSGPRKRAPIVSSGALLKLDAEIARVELKLYNSTTRRDHLGSDDLGRDYWALSGPNQTPMLVVSECDVVGRAEFEGTIDSAFTYVEQSGRGGADGKDLSEDDTVEKSTEKKTRWWTYKTEASIDALLAWLSPTVKVEQALKNSICHWRESLMKLYESSREANQESGDELQKENTSPARNITIGSPKTGLDTAQPLKVASKRFPTLKATTILQMRYGSSSSSDRIVTKKSMLQMEGRVTRCSCLEPMWKLKWHCQACHESYESSAELEGHRNACPDAIAADSLSKKKQKLSGKGKNSLTPRKEKVGLTPEKGKKKGRFAFPKKEGKRRLPEKEDAHMRICEENSWMTEEASEPPTIHRHATRSKTQAPPLASKSGTDPDVNGNWAMQDEPVDDAFYLSDFQDDLQHPGVEGMGSEDINMGFGSFPSFLQDEEWEANLRPDKSESKRKKQGSGKKSSKQAPTQGTSEVALANFDYASLPMIFSTPDSTRDRILQIGCIADQGPTFAPALHFAPAFDPSLMIQPYYPNTDEGSTDGAPVSSPVPVSHYGSPSEELNTKDFDEGGLDAVSWYDPQTSGEVPADVAFAPDTGDTEPVVHSGSGATWDDKWAELVGLSNMETEDKYVSQTDGACALNVSVETVPSDGVLQIEGACALNATGENIPSDGVPQTDGACALNTRFENVLSSEELQPRFPLTANREEKAAASGSEVQPRCALNATEDEIDPSSNELQPTSELQLQELSPYKPEAVPAHGPEVAVDRATVEVRSVIPSSITMKKPSKRFAAPEASLQPLVGEQLGILKGLKMRLLDMEAAMGNETLIPIRSASARRRAWRSLVKSAQCIYEMTKAVIILEQMVRADCIKRTWCYWSCLSAAARSATLSTLALRIYAFDAAVTYKKDKVIAEDSHRPSTAKKSKKKVQVEVPTSKKKKTKKVS